MRIENRYTPQYLKLRKEKLDRQFRLTKAKTRKLILLNYYLTMLSERLYDRALELCSIYDRFIAEGKDIYRNYTVNGYICCENRDAACSPSNTLPGALLDNTRDDIWHISLYENTSDNADIAETNSRDRQLQLSLFNNIGIFDEPPLNERPLCCFLSELYGANETYSLDDLVLMNTTDFFIDIEALWEK